jgi:hypothetical protein
MYRRYQLGNGPRSGIAFFGFIIFGLATGPLVNMLANAIRTALVRMFPVGEEEAKISTEAGSAGLIQGALQITASFFISCIWLLVMGLSVCFKDREGWQLGDAFYWAFITSTSIGFGDMSPDCLPTGLGTDFHHCPFGADCSGCVLRDCERSAYAGCGSCDCTVHGMGAEDPRAEYGRKQGGGGGRLRGRGFGPD